MMADIEDKFKSSTASVYDYLADPRFGFLIPIYQRDYAWSQEKVYDLVTDIASGVASVYEQDESDKYTYIGTFITTDGKADARRAQSIDLPEHVVSLVDGQQRISSISLLALVLLIEFDVSKKKLLKVSEQIPSDPGLAELADWLDELISSLERMLVFEYVGKKGIAPKLIRAQCDRWVVGGEAYASPIPYLVHDYWKRRANASNQTFSARNPPNWPHGQSNHEKDRFNDIRSRVQAVTDGRDFADPKDDWFSILPPYEILASNSGVSKKFLDRTIPVLSEVTGDDGVYFANLVRLLVFSSYFLKRVAMTVVRGMTEDIAFEVFERLNTTGEPLNPYETFKPGVIRLIPFDRYITSKEKLYFDYVDRVFARPRTSKQKSKLVTDTLISFALAHDGERIGKGLSEQVQYLKRSFYERKVSIDTDCRHEYLQLLWNSAEISYIFSDRTFTNSGRFIEIIQADDEVRLCCSFLAEIRHTLAYPLITRFYSDYLESTMLQREDRCSAQEIRSVIKAITAFSVLWRTAWGGTAGIDGIYRSLMGGSSTTSFSKTASRNRRISAQELKDELRRRLFQDRAGRRGVIGDKRNWKQLARVVPIGGQTQLSKFLLLLAQHDCVPDSNTPGLIRPGVRNSHSYFTFDNFHNNRYWIEHIAPRAAVSGQWDHDVYEDPNVKDRLGNLVILPDIDNIISGNQSWLTKKHIYTALVKNNVEDRELSIKASGLHLTDHQRELILSSEFQPALASIVQRDHWNLEIVNKRTDCLLDLVWDRLTPWLR